MVANFTHLKPGNFTRTLSVVLLINFLLTSLVKPTSNNYITDTILVYTKYCNNTLYCYEDAKITGNDK